jgi:hypothetical protein
VIHVDGLTIAPPVARDPGAIHHLPRIRGNALPVKRRLHETALPEVESPLARQETFAEEHLRALQDVPLHEDALVRHEHVAHVIRVREEIQSQVSHLRGGDVAMLAVQRE